MTVALVVVPLGVVAVRPPGDEVTVYEVIGLPPLEAGAVQLTVASALPAATFPIYAVEGLPGHVAGSGSSGDEVSSVTVAHGPLDHSITLHGRDGYLQLSGRRLHAIDRNGLFSGRSRRSNSGCRRQTCRSRGLGRNAS